MRGRGGGSAAAAVQVHRLVEETGRRRRALPPSAPPRHHEGIPQASHGRTHAAPKKLALNSQQRRQCWPTSRSAHTERAAATAAKAGGWKEQRSHRNAGSTTTGGHPERRGRRGAENVDNVITHVRSPHDPRAERPSRTPTATTTSARSPQPRQTLHAGTHPHQRAFGSRSTPLAARTAELVGRTSAAPSPAAPPARGEQRKRPSAQALLRPPATLIFSRRGAWPRGRPAWPFASRWAA